MFSPSSTPMNPDGRYHLHMSGKLPSCQLLDDRMVQYDSLFPEAQRRINTGEEGAAAVLFGRLSEYLA